MYNKLFSFYLGGGEVDFHPCSLLGCFACCTASGVQVFNTDPLQEKRKISELGTCSLVQMMGRSNFIAIVSGGKSPIFDDSTGKRKCPPPSSQGFDPQPTERDPLGYYFTTSFFWQTVPINFLKPPIYAYSEGGARAKKR